MESGAVATQAVASSSGPSAGKNKVAKTSTLSSEPSKKKAKAMAMEVLEQSSDEDKDVARKTQPKQVGLTDSARKELDEKLRLKLRDHTWESITDVMTAISHEPRQSPFHLNGMVDIIVTELIQRAMNDKNIAQDIAAIDKINEELRIKKLNAKAHLKGLPKQTRKRLELAEEKLQMSETGKQDLRDMLRWLGDFSRGSTEEKMEAKIIQILRDRAHQGSDLIEESEIIGRYCYDGCTYEEIEELRLEGWLSEDLDDD